MTTSAGRALPSRPIDDSLASYQSGAGVDSVCSTTFVASPTPDIDHAALEEANPLRNYERDAQVPGPVPISEHALLADETAELMSFTLAQDRFAVSDLPSNNFFTHAVALSHQRNDSVHRQPAIDVLPKESMRSLSW